MNRFKALVEAINSNIEQINVGNELGQDLYVPMIRLQYIVDEINAPVMPRKVGVMTCMKCQKEQGRRKYCRACNFQQY
jgi:hypothetical protein